MRVARSLGENKKIDAQDDEIILADEGALKALDINIDYANTWFGVPEYYVKTMEQMFHDAWLTDHMAVNRKYGFDRARYQKDFQCDNMTNRQFRSLFPGGDFC